MDILELARDSGLTMLLDGKIGRQEYTSVSGSLDALQLFAQMIRAASLDEFRRSRRSSAAPDPPRSTARSIRAPGGWRRACDGC